jgi:DNA-binding response OmpR family regulator
MPSPSRWTTPIVVMSAVHPTTTAAVLGAQAILLKPFDLDRLLTILRVLLGEQG